MRVVLERGVPQEERRKAVLAGLTDWDAARIFLEVVRCGSFRSTAERLDLSINVIRRRIDDLRFHRRGKHNDRIGQAIYNVAPKVQFKRWYLIFLPGS